MPRPDLNARRRAWVALANAHADEFRLLLNAERAKEGLPPVGELVGTGAPAINRAKERCPAGHDYLTHGRTYVDSAGHTHRQCRECVRERNRVWRLSKREAVSA